MMYTASGSGILIRKDYPPGDKQETLTSNMMATLLEAISKLQLQQKVLGNQLKDDQKEVTSRLEGLQSNQFRNHGECEIGFTPESKGSNIKIIKPTK